MTTHRTKATTGAADLASDQVEVDDFANCFDCVVVLCEPHRPAGDGLLGFDEYSGGLTDLCFSQAGLFD